LACYLKIYADPDSVPDPTYHFNVDLDVDPDLHFHFDADEDPGYLK
jgi:hypothetical protein